MLFLYLLASASPLSYTATIKAGKHGYAIIPDNYNEANLHIEAGEGLMMVEWENAVLNISIPSIGIENQQFYNSLGYSLFTFKNDADINIKFNTQISYFFFPGPYLKTNAAYQFISNINTNEFKVNTNLELYFGTFGPYDLSTSLSINGNGHVIYCQNKEWINKDFIRSFDLQNIEYLSVLQNTRNTLMFSGKVFMNSKKSYTPTVPTRVALEYGRIEQNEYKINENMAYGGDETNNNGKSNKLIDIYNTHYLTLINDVKYDSDYSLYYRDDDDGEYKDLLYFNKEKDSEFEVDVFMLSQKCKTYTLVNKFVSSKYKFGSNGYLENISINNDFLPKHCLKDKAISGTLIGCIVLAIVLVIVIIVFVVIIVKQRRKSNSSQEGKSTENI